MSLIKNLDAVEQPLDFLPFCRYSKTMSDIDCCLWLRNDKLLLIEIKKDTFAHSKEDIIDSTQLNFLRKIAGNRPNVYFIYATHNQEIDLKVPIQVANCKVRYVEYAGKKINFGDSKALLDVVHYITHKIDNAKYHIIVKYPNYELKHAIRNPIGPKWILNKYIPVSCDFNTENEAIKYIEARFRSQDYNRLNSYILMKKEESGEDLFVREYKFTSSN